jgi:hypothetical protein
MIFFISSNISNIDLLSFSSFDAFSAADESQHQLVKLRDCRLV